MREVGKRYKEMVTVEKVKKGTPTVLKIGEETYILRPKGMGRSVKVPQQKNSS